MIISNVVNSSIKNLPDAVKVGSFLEFLPEPLGNFRDCINSKSIDVISGNEPVDPVKKCLLNILRFCIQIRKACQTTVFNSPLIASKIFLIDVTVGVVIVWTSELLNRSIVSSNRSDMISNDIDHYPHISSMHLGNKILKVLLSSEILV